MDTIRDRRSVRKLQAVERRQTADDGTERTWTTHWLTIPAPLVRALDWQPGDMIAFRITVHDGKPSLELHKAR